MQCAIDLHHLSADFIGPIEPSATWQALAEPWRRAGYEVHLSEVNGSAVFSFSQLISFSDSERLMSLLDARFELVQEAHTAFTSILHYLGRATRFQFELHDKDNGNPMVMFEARSPF